MKSVRRPYERLNLSVGNQSDRHGATITLIVLHTTESQDAPGIVDLRGLGRYFDDPGSRVSSHVGVDGDGHSAMFVPDEREAWTCAHYNPVSLNIEMIGYAAFVPWQWRRRRAQVRKVAKYIAWWSKAHHIPIQRGRVQSGRVVRWGVVTHRSLGALGGGHRDPGRSFPFWATLALARYYARNGW